MNALLLIAALLLPVPALAHVGDGLHAGLMAGFLHPFSGADHLLAMVTLGVWAGLLGGAARLVLPGAFLGAMATGAILGVTGVALPGVEAGVLASVLVLGALVALMVRLPLAAGAALAGVFGLLHGHAHGTEMLGGSFALYAAGFLVATSVLLASGLALASATAPWARQAARTAGGAAVAAGVVLLLAV
ncbi:urease accessory protein [Siccirubricoccus deserti]|uniref:HupE/UreJ family protein n=1 Tax=Siccirubricoccus deserti TaxID=2013562 RepID=A0A9X0QVJ6_9PROT|nr:HupE/UreJ family protein [Siccirubricoccus deserti]MBC4014197.1 HupE/UreJ family protein [Siccirubricoccus deserti]GGC27302.1 urease accessory protein [Siccirubricoccus deserti]